MIQVKITEQKRNNKVLLRKMGAGKVVATFNQSAREGVQTMINTVIPFMAFVSLIGVIQGSGIGEFLPISWRHWQETLWV